MVAVVAVFLEQIQWHHQTTEDLLFFNIQPQMTCIGHDKMKIVVAHSQAGWQMAQFQVMLEVIFVLFEIMELLEYM